MPGNLDVLGTRVRSILYSYNPRSDDELRAERECNEAPVRLLYYEDDLVWTADRIGYAGNGPEFPLLKTSHMKKVQLSDTKWLLIGGSTGLEVGFVGKGADVTTINTIMECNYIDHSFSFNILPITLPLTRVFGEAAKLNNHILYAGGIEKKKATTLTFTKTIYDIIINEDDGSYTVSPFAAALQLRTAKAYFGSLSLGDSIIFAFGKTSATAHNKQIDRYWLSGDGSWVRKTDLADSTTAPGAGNVGFINNNVGYITHGPNKYDYKYTEGLTKITYDPLDHSYRKENDLGTNTWNELYEYDQHNVFFNNGTKMPYHYQSLVNSSQDFEIIRKFDYVWIWTGRGPRITTFKFDPDDGSITSIKFRDLIYPLGDEGQYRNLLYGAFAATSNGSNSVVFGQPSFYSDVGPTGWSSIVSAIIFNPDDNYSFTRVYYTDLIPEISNAFEQLSNSTYIGMVISDINIPLKSFALVFMHDTEFMLTSGVGIKAHLDYLGYYTTYSPKLIVYEEE